MNPTPLLTRALLAALLAPAALLAQDSSSLKANLAPKADTDATGSAVASLKSKKSELIVKVANLTASKTYNLEVDGIVEGTLTTDSKGKGSAKFVTPAAKNTQLLDFDPRGKLLRVLDASVSQLEGIISGKNENSGAVVDERAELKSENAPAKAKARARYTVTSKGKRTLRVEMSNVTGGPFTVRVDGIARGTMTLRGKNALATFDTEPKGGAVLLDFDPRGLVVEIFNGDQVLFSGRLEARVRGVNSASPSQTGVLLPAVNAPGGSKAVAKLRIDQRARKQFSVELEDVAPGAYDLLVEGVKQGTINVVNVTGGTEGEIEFKSGDDNSSELPLNFDPVGKTIRIAQGTNIFFEGVFNPNVGGTGTPGAEPESKLEELLTSTGLDGDGKGEAKYEVDDKGRHKFSVEIEDVPVGAYTLTVAGSVRGTIMVKLIAATGKIEGELEFESENEPGKKVLNFDPRGQTIEISNATGVFFSHLFGSGSATQGGGNVTPFDVVVALTNLGVDTNASGEAELKRDLDGSLSFEVEVEDLDLGPYELLVGGQVRGTITVQAVSNGTKGKIEFESDRAPLLNFEVAGQEIIVRKGTTIYFSRVFPTP